MADWQATPWLARALHGRRGLRWLRWPPPPDDHADENEYPARRVAVPRYFVSRYPVTVRQWIAFREDIRHGRWEPKRPDGALIEDKDFDPDAERGALDWPVVDVSWYEALAYCDWLTTRLREHRATPEPLATLLRNGDQTSGSRPWSISLPSEREWEKAARGPHDARVFPWARGARWRDPDRVSGSWRTRFSGAFESTTRVRHVVGAHRSGRSPSGAEDLMGTPWQWTRSRWVEGDSRRVIRGGAFRFSNRGLGCASRDRYHPDLRPGYGFRVVATPFNALDPLDP